MNNDQDHPVLPSPWPNEDGSQSHLIDGHTDREPYNSQLLHSQSNAQPRNAYSSSFGNVSRAPERPKVPTRAATLKYPETDRTSSTNTYVPHARSEDLNHGVPSNFQPSSYPGSSARPSPPFIASAGASRPPTPGDSLNPKQSSSSGHADALDRPMASTSSSHSDDSLGKSPPTTISSASGSLVLT